MVANNAIDSQLPTHGRLKDGKLSPEYSAWMNAKQRCHNPCNPGYRNYGARGIEVCERWRNSFENFLTDMGYRPSGTSLERKMNDAGYNQDNCVWATKKEQERNKRTSRKIVVNGKSCSIPEVLPAGLSYQTVYYRVLRGHPTDRLLEPIFSGPRPGKWRGRWPMK